MSLYANDLTLCKSALLLINSQLQIQLAVCEERVEMGLRGWMWHKICEENSPNVLSARIR